MPCICCYCKGCCDTRGLPSTMWLRVSYSYTCAPPPIATDETIYYKLPKVACLEDGTVEYGCAFDELLEPVDCYTYPDYEIPGSDTCCTVILRPRNVLAFGAGCEEPGGDVLTPPSTFGPIVESLIPIEPVGEDPCTVENIDDNTTGDFAGANLCDCPGAGQITGELLAGWNVKSGGVTVGNLTLSIYFVCNVPEVATVIEPNGGGPMMAIGPASPKVESVPATGPGTELKKLLAEATIAGAVGCGCAAYAKRMDCWGPAGCREHRAEIVDWLNEAWKRLGWLEKIRAAAGLVVSGAPLSLSDPVGALVDEAVRRAEAKVI